VNDRSRWIWLAAIMALALAMRLWHLNDGLEQDEFGPLYAVAQRVDSSPGVIPSKSDPIVPVASWKEVRQRSVLPYGVVNPAPLYHYLLYGVVQALPIAEWSLRLPSLLAGLATVAAMYSLGRRMMGVTLGLLAALLTAFEPMQIIVSDLARPYALANLACVLSFIALFDMLYAERGRQVVLAGITYGCCLAFIGYMNPLLLLVGAAHASVFFFWWRDRAGAGEPLGLRLAAWFAGCALAAALFWPELDYFFKVQQFAGAQRDYLDRMAFRSNYLVVPLNHNSTFLVAMLALAGARVLTKIWIGPTQAQLSALDARGREARRLSRTWLLAPQAAIMLVALLAARSGLLSRYLSYVPLGGMLVLAIRIFRGNSLQLRLAMSAAAVLMMIFWGNSIMGRGIGLQTPNYARQIVERLDRLDHDAQWQSGDAVVVRGAFLEADFQPDGIPADTRADVERLIASPLTTLYGTETSKPLVCLTVSLRYGDKLLAGPQSVACQFERFYTDELAQRLGTYKRLWLCDPLWKRQQFRYSFLLWLAETLHAELRVTEDINSPNGPLVVRPGMNPDEFKIGAREYTTWDPVTITLIEIVRP
jgi:hypothetical protein